MADGASSASVSSSEAAAASHVAHVLTIRLIKNMEYRTVKTIYVKDVDLHITIRELMDRVQQQIATTPALLAHRGNKYDTMKIQHQPFQAKTCNLTVRLDEDDLYMCKPEKTLAECNIQNETEISYFNLEAYEIFKANPEVKW